MAEGPDKKDAEAIKGILKAVQEEARKANQTFQQLTIRGNDLAGAMQRMGSELGKSGEKLQQMAQLSDSFLKTADKTNQAHIAITNQIKEQFAYETQLAQTEDQKLQAKMKYNAEIQNANNAADALKAVTQQQVKAQQDIVKLQTAKNTGLRGEALSAAANYQMMLQQGTITQQQYNDIVETLKEQQSITQELEDQLAMEEAIAQEVLDISNTTDNYKKKLQGVLATAQAIGNDPAAMGGLALTKAIGLAGDAYESFEDLRHEGMSAGQALDATMKSFSVNAMLGLSDTKGAIKGLVDEFGTINNVSSDTIDQIGTVAHEMGISGQEAASLTAQMSQMAGETTEVAANTLEYTNELAKANGIAPGKITKEMAANTKDMHLFTKGGSKEFAKIAVEAHKIGVEMSTAANMANGLLDFESSIEKQMEASVLLGKEINLDKARQLALEGKSVEAAKEVVKQMGGIDQFNSMNVLQQQAAAEAAGMNVAELKKALDAKENGGKLSEENASQESEHMGHMLEMAAKMGGFLKNNATLMLSFLQFLTSGGIEKTMQYAKDAAQWAKEKAHMMWKKITGESITKAASEGGADKGKKVLDAAGGGADKGKKVLDAAGGGADKGKELSDKAGKVKKPGGFKAAMKGIREGIQEFAKQPAKTLQGAATLAAAGVLLALGLAAIMKAMTVAGGPVEMIAAGVALVAFAFSFKLMADALGKVPIGSVLKGALALVVLGGALTVAAFAFSLLAGVDVGTIIAFSIALPLLALAAAGLGFLIVPIGLGALALGILGVALMAVAGAMLMFASAEGGVQALQGFLMTFAENPGVGIAMLGTAMAMFVFSGALFALAIAAFFGAPALIALGAGMFMLGLGVKFASEGLESISKSLPAIAEGVGALGEVVPMLALASLYLMQLGFASLIAAPGLLIGSFALGMLAATMGIFAAAVNLAIPGVGLLLQLGSMSEAFAMIAESMWSMAAGITAFATAGLLTLPTIMGLIALSFVAPILTLLGDSINYDLGGGSSVKQAPEEDKMNVLIEEIRALRAAFQTPGTINMDGQKVGDVLGLAVSNSGVS